LRRLQGDASRVVREMKRAVSAKDFEGAVQLRERELELRGEIRRLTQTLPAAEPAPEVTRADVDVVISSWTGIPVTTLREDEADRPPTWRRFCAAGSSARTRRSPPSRGRSAARVSA
jgi:ATP-dependent Clp protease ATP-binding subunit ClpC